jgi:hypothetical protein
MNLYGWTSWGWYDSGGPGIDKPEHLRRWKWKGRQDLFVETNDERVLLHLASRLNEEEL